MWRPADPHVIAQIVCDQKHKFIRRANKVFAPDTKFLQWKKDQLVETYTPVVYTVPSVMKRCRLDEMRSLCGDIGKLTLIELRKTAQERGIKGYYKYNKAQLIEAIRRKNIF